MPKILNRRAFVQAGLRQYFSLYVRRCFMALHPDAQFIENWHIDAILYQLERVRRGEINRLIINLPPRYLKSLIASIAFPAFLLGHDPGLKIFGISYADPLTRDISIKFRSIIESDWHSELFPLLQFLRILDNEVLTTQHGYRKATTVFGSITGMGGDYFIIDDPMKPTDAYSEIKREACNAWYRNVLFSRLDDKASGAIIIIMQRLHLDDLCGFLTGHFDNFEVLNLAAIAEADERIAIGDGKFHLRKAGEALNPRMEPLETLAEIRASMGSTDFQAQYQQQPVPPGGAMIKREWIQTYKVLPPRTYQTRIVQSWDCASKEGGQNDWSVCTTWQFEPGKYFLIDVFRKRMNYPTLKAEALRLIDKYRPTEIVIEDAGVGTALAQELHGFGRTVILEKPSSDKESRMAVHSAKFEAKQVFFPESAAWLNDLLPELHSFPNGRHDDQVDSISQALSREKEGYTLRYIR